MIETLKKLFKNRSSHYVIKTDLHSHLIPGIDDGVRTIQEALQCLQELKKLGFKKIITTPHVMNHRFQNSSQTIRNGLEKLKIACLDNEIDIEIEVAAEYYLDNHFLTLLENRDILTFGPEKQYLLFEISYMVAPLGLSSIINRMQSLGYIPVLAHPERYIYFHSDFSEYERLKEIGVLFQLNINSLSGYYSIPVKNLAKRLIKKRMIDFIGSDVHKPSHVKKLKSSMESNLYQQLLQNPLRNNLL